MSKLIGIDIVEFEEIKERISDRFIARLLSLRELERYEKMKSTDAKIAYLAGRFAAKEALLKATDSDILRYDLSKIEITNQESKKPMLNINIDELNNKIRALLNKNIYKINISLSHEKDYSVAQVIIY